MNILSVNVGRAVDAEWAGNTKRTAIDKRSVAGRVSVLPNGLSGDERADMVAHGSPTQAVYAYAREDYDWWEKELDRPLANGQFGENLTTTGVDVNGVLLGEQWRVGSALLEVTAPRIPCVVFRNWLSEQGWVRRFTQAARPGAYFRVLEQGDLAAGDKIDVVWRPETSVTLTESFHAYHGDRDLMRRLLAFPGHAEVWDRVAERVLKPE